MNTNFVFSQKVIVVAMLAAFGSAHAEDVAQYILPDSTISAGVAGTSGNQRDRALFGQYNGMRKDSAYPLLDLDIKQRDEATGTWLTLQGRNLGLDTRELNVAYERQGKWKISADYNEMIRNDPRTINTAMQGIGSTTPTVVLAAPGTGTDVNLKVTRKALGVAGEVWLTSNLHFEASFKNEDKEGSRLNGIGFSCTSSTAPGCVGPTATRTGWALLMIPEPIKSTTQQFEAKLNYSTDSLNLTGGYYGSFFINDRSGVSPNVPGTLFNALGTALPLNTGLQAILQNRIALAPDNQAHQFFVSGNYTFTATTKANFKVAYTHASQNDDFGGNGFTQAPAGVSNLGAKVNTTLTQFGITSRPIPKLSLLANVRYEDKQDKTPIALYNTEGTNTFTNGRQSSKKLAGKLEASYQLPANYRATLGVDYDSIDRGTFTSTDQVAGLTGLRQKTEEWGYRAELRRAMSESLTGAIGFGGSHRTGSTWLRLNGGAVTGVIPVSDTAIYNRTGIFPMTMENRDRKKVKLSADWAATDRLSFQFLAENGFDVYSAPSEKGLRNTRYSLYSVDASFTLSDQWKFTGYWSHGNQGMRVDHSTAYRANLQDINDTVGFGVIGKPTGKLEVGGDLSYIRDLNRYGQALDGAASAANNTFLYSSGGLPDVTFKQVRAKLYAKYAVEKNGTLRFDLIHERNKLNDWTWGYGGTAFYYSDGTTVGMKQDQHVTYLGAAYIYQWR